jgi:hypothetical protein
MGRHFTMNNMQWPKDSSSKLNKRCSLTEVLARLTANANVATVLRSVPAKRKTKRGAEKEKETFLSVLDVGRGGRSQFQGPLPWFSTFNILSMLVCLFMLQKSSFIYTFFYDNCMGH